MISEEIRQSLLVRPFSSSEILLVGSIGEDKLSDYIRNYDGVPLSRDWVKRKGHSKFWLGLGKDGYHAFERSSYSIIHTPAKDGNYYIGYFEFKCTDRFKYASGSRLYRTLLGDGILAFDSTGKETQEFCQFLTDLMIEGVVENGMA